MNLYTINKLKWDDYSDRIESHIPLYGTYLCKFSEDKWECGFRVFINSEELFRHIGYAISRNDAKEVCQSDFEFRASAFVTFFNTKENIDDALKEAYNH